MTQKQFWILLLAVVAISAVSILLLWQLADCAPSSHQFVYVTAAFLIFLSVQLYYWGRFTATLANLNVFQVVLVAGIFLRLFGMGALVFIYRLEVADQLVCSLIPFGWLYLFFTVLESYVLSKLG